MALTDKLTAIADAVREKTGKADEMTLDQMAVEIEGISGGGSGGEKNTHVTDIITTEEVDIIYIPLQNYEDAEMFLYIRTNSETFKFKFSVTFPPIGTNKYTNYGTAVASSAQYGINYGIRIYNDNTHEEHRYVGIQTRVNIVSTAGPYYSTIEPGLRLNPNTSGEVFPIGTHVRLVELY